MHRLAAFKVLPSIVLAPVWEMPLVSIITKMYSSRVIALALVLALAMASLFLSLRNNHRLWVKAHRNRPSNMHLFSQNLGENSLTFGSLSAPQGATVQVIAGLMGLKSTILFAGPDLVHSTVIASTGELAEEVLHYLSSQSGPYSGDVQNQDLVELPWESSSLIFISLAIGRRHIGHVVLGPKDNGEAFDNREKQALVSVIPLLSAIVDDSEFYQRLTGVNDRLVRVLGALNLHLARELRMQNQRLLQAREEERARIADDLHDGSLQKAMLLIQKQHESETLARQLVFELRETASRLRPSILDDLGIVAALEWLICDMTRGSRLHASLSLDNIDAEERFPPDIELALFRIAQEAVNNALKHSQGTSLDVYLSRDGDDITLRVTDNGIGFPPESQGDDGVGLLGMQRRAFQLGGSFRVRTAPGQGTLAIARIPLDRQVGSSIGGEY
jgi:signal transduction histidine kinase